jgi:hypothetical protein
MGEIGCDEIQRKPDVYTSSVKTSIGRLLMQLLLSKFNLKYFIHMLILVREKNFCLF